MLRTFFHLACQIEGGSDNEIRVCLADLILDIEPLEIYLSGSKGLLAGGQAFAQLDEFCDRSAIGIVTLRQINLTLVKVNVQQALIRQRELRMGDLVSFPKSFPKIGQFLPSEEPMPALR